MPVKKNYARSTARSARSKSAYQPRPKARAPAKRRQAAPRRQQPSGSLGRTLLEEGGSMVGGLFGVPGIGKAAGGALSTVLGLGDYEVKQNLFLEGRLPKMVNIPGQGGTVIRFQEYLSDVYTTPNIGAPDAFNLQSYIINAANQDCFPWLSQIAGNYEQYFIEGMLFEFRSTSANALNSTNTALGSVMMATQYDVADAIFASKAEMLNYEFSNSTKPSDSAVHMIECAPSQTVLNGLYTLNGNAPAGTDSRLYHLGRFCIATVGFQAANVNIGELHVTYQVRLLKPKLYNALGFDNGFGILVSTGASAYSNASPLSGVYSLLANSNSNLIAAVAGGTCSLGPSSVIKTYRIEVNWIGSGAVGIIIPVPTVANCTLVQNTLIGGTNTQAFATFIITTTGNSKAASFSFPAATLPTGPLQTIIRIMQIPQGSTN